MLIFPESLPFPSAVNIVPPDRTARSGEGGATKVRARSLEYIRKYSVTYSFSADEYAVFSAFNSKFEGTRISMNLPGRGGYKHRYSRIIRAIPASANDYCGFDVQLEIEVGATCQ